jgi:hypothetical protein
MLPGPTRVVSVSYFDVRIAAAAIEALGGKRYCPPAPQQGARSVRLPGDFNLGVEDAKGVSRLLRTDDKDESFTVEFFDIRSAERVRKLVASADADIEPPPGLEFRAHGPARKARNAEVDAVKRSFLACAPWLSRTEQHIVTVHGLPNALLVDSCLEAILQQAGLQNDVASFSTKRGSPCGEAVVVLSSADAAQRCVKHFDKRRWDPSGTAVKARLLAPEAPAKPRRRCDTVDTTASTEAGPSDGEEDQEGESALA